MAESSSWAPSGVLCECGCGQPAPISPYTNKTRGYVKGEPRRFIHGHSRRLPAAPEGTKWCSGCQDYLPSDSFAPKADAYCRVCANNKRQEYVERYEEQYRRADRNKKLKKRYSITVDEYDALHAAQQGICAICKSETDKLVVDHDHNTGKVRGLLCNTCNLGIGGLKDSPTILLSAIDYLETSA